MAELVPPDDLPAEPVKPARLVPMDDLPDAAPPQAPGVTRTEALLRGGAQGLTLGHGDEIGGAVKAARSLHIPQDRRTPGPRALAEMYPGVSYPEAASRWFNENRPDLAVANDAEYARQVQGEAYKVERDKIREANDRAAYEQPGWYMTGEVASAVPLMALTGGGALPVAGQGVIQGLGYSNSDTAAGLVSDGALGGAGGLAGYAAGQGVGRGLGWLRKKGADLLRSGTDRAAQQAAEESAAAVRSLEGAARERAANAYRQMERINLALADPALPAAERATLEAFKQSPEYAALLAANAKGIAGAAPEALAEREAAAAIASEARAALPGAIENRTGELLTPQPKADLKSFAKGWVEPLAWMYGGKKAGEAMGLDPEDTMLLMGGAGLIGGRTRAGKALWTRLNRPAHQAAIGRWMEGKASAALSPGVARTGTGLLRMAGVSGGAALSPELQQFIAMDEDPLALADAIRKGNR